MTRWGREEVVETTLGPIRCRVAGKGPGGLLFVHGFLVDGRLWDGVAPRFADRFRVVCPDLPLGAHRTPVPDRSRLSPETVADVLVEISDALGLDPLVVVGNDSGGAITQVAMARHRARLAGAVLVSCDAYENFPPRAIKPMLALAHWPPAMRLFSLLFGSPVMGRTGLPLWLVARKRMPDALVRSWGEGLWTSDAVRRDTAALVLSAGPEATLSAAATFGDFRQPVLVVWARQDRFFPSADAERLATELPNATLRWVDDSHTFVSMDQPEALAAAMDEWLGKHFGSAT